MSYEQKLFFLLMLLVILPCILLAGFAMQALTGQKVLIEQKIQEGYKALAHSTQKRILDRIKTKENFINTILLQSPWLGKEPSVPLLEKPLKEDRFFKFVYIIDFDYNIIYPRERFSRLVTDTFIPVENYNVFEAAYRHEFQNRDYNAAIEEYEQIAREAHDQRSESVGYALMAIARCHYKTDRIDRALEKYQELATFFSNRSDLQGLTFLIHAKSQIAELYKKQNDNIAYYKTLVDLLQFIVENEDSLLKAQYQYHYRQLDEKLSILTQDSTISVENRNRFLQQREEIFQKQEQMNLDEEALRTAHRYILPLLKLITRQDRYSSGYLDYRIGSQVYLAYYHPLTSGDGHLKGYLISTVDIQHCLKEIIMPILQSQAGGKEIFLAVVDQTNQAVLGEIPGQFYQVASQHLAPVFTFWSVAVYLEHFRSLDELSRYRSRIYFVGVIIVILILLIGVYSTIATFIREMKSARLKSDFVSNVTHELKTPLTAIKMFVETLLERSMNKDEQRECLQIIAAETNRLQRLIDRILDFAKMEQKRRTFHLIIQDMEVLVREVVAHFQNQIPESEAVVIQINVEPGLPKILVDAEAVGEALMNLLSNASKYNDKPQRHIEISCARRGDNYLAIAVKDNGVGIPKQEFSRIFQNFYRIENSHMKHIPGTGLGLALVDSIVKAHRGKIEVESKVGVGSVFTMVLNCQQSENLKADVGVKNQL